MDIILERFGEQHYKTHSGVQIQNAKGERRPKYRRYPEWLNNDQKIAAVLQRLYPKAHLDAKNLNQCSPREYRQYVKHRRMALIWACVIVRYFRNHGSLQACLVTLNETSFFHVRVLKHRKGRMYVAHRPLRRSDLEKIVERIKAVEVEAEGKGKEATESESYLAVSNQSTYVSLGGTFKVY